MSKALDKIKRDLLQATQDVTLIAVSKGQNEEKIILKINEGLTHFGENRVQEAIHKWSELKEKYPQVILHMIGPLQRNKVKEALGIFDYFHSLDRLSLIEKFGKHPQAHSKKFFIQVNIGQEPQKSGAHPDDLPKLLVEAKEHNLNVIGLMAIPPQNKDPRIFFRKLRELGNQYYLPHLSMGMSHDYLVALNEGATYIRLGRILFD